jgi:hypothetical protein
LKTRLAKRLLKLRVDEIVIKIHVASDKKGKSVVKLLRLIATSMEGK